LRGQDLLSRAHALGKTIEAHVRQALGETVPPSRMGFPATPLLRRGNESPR
jgi:hypothetical protein